MSNYANYDDYINIYLNGRDVLIPSTTFNYYSQKATNEIKSRIYADIVIDDDVKNCTCEIAEFLFNAEESTNKAIANSTKGVSSESVGGYSVTYATTTSVEYTAQNKNKTITDIVNSWLGRKTYAQRGGVIGVY